MPSWIFRLDIPQGLQVLLMQCHQKIIDLFPEKLCISSILQAKYGMTCYRWRRGVSRKQVFSFFFIYEINYPKTLKEVMTSVQNDLSEIEITDMREGFRRQETREIQPKKGIPLLILY